MKETKDFSNTRITKGKAIREKCLDCCCGQEFEVKNCSILRCSLWRYRMGYELKDDLNPLLRGNTEILEPSTLLLRN